MDRRPAPITRGLGFESCVVPPDPFPQIEQSERTQDGLRRFSRVKLKPSADDSRITGCHSVGPALLENFAKLSSCLRLIARPSRDRIGHTSTSRSRSSPGFRSSDKGINSPTVYVGSPTPSGGGSDCVPSTYRGS